MTHFLVTYLRLRIGEDGRIPPTDAQFGSIEPTLEQAEKLARSLVNEFPISHGCILPRVLSAETLIDGMYDAQEAADRIIAQMNENQAVIAGNKKCGRKKKPTPCKSEIEPAEPDHA